MTKTTNITNHIPLILLSLSFFLLPIFVNAATYAYVAKTGEIKSIEATDWMTAIKIAPDIHMNSGVFLLK